MLAHGGLDMVPRGHETQVLVHAHDRVPVALLGLARVEVNNGRHLVHVELEAVALRLLLVERGAPERLVLAVVVGGEGHEAAVEAGAQHTLAVRTVEAYARRRQAVAVALPEEASRAVAHVEYPHLERVVRRRGDHERLELESVHTVHRAAVGLAHLRHQLLILQVPDGHVAQIAPADHYRTSV